MLDDCPATITGSMFCFIAYNTELLYSVYLMFVASLAVVPVPIHHVQ